MTGKDSVAAVLLALALARPMPAQAQAAAGGPEPPPGHACVSTSPATPAGGEAPFVRADVRSIAEIVTCYCGCPHLQVSKCFCGTADAIRSDFAARLDRGETAEAVIAAYVAEHGPSILAVPPRRGFHWSIWLGPPLLLLAGGVLVWINGRRWSRPGGAPELSAVTLDPEQEARYRAALRRAVEE